MAKDSYWVRFFTGIWDDPWFDALPSDKYKLCWIYLIAPCEFKKCGIIELNRRRLCQRLRIPKPRLPRMLDRFIDDEKIVVSGDYLWVVNFTSYQNYGGSAAIALQTELNDLENSAPDLVLQWRNAYPGYTQGTPEVHLGSHINRNINRNNETKAEDLPLLFDPEEQAILDALKVISERGQGDYDAQATVKYIRTNLSKDFPYAVILQAARTMDGWLLKPKNQREAWSHARLRRFCDGIPLPKSSGEYSRPPLEVVE